MSGAKWRDYREARYYFITDRGLSRQGSLADVREAVAGGVKIVQYREKGLPLRERLEEARAIGRFCRESGVAFLINDRVDIALAVEADGVHLGQDDMPFVDARRVLGRDKIIGVSARNVTEAVQARELGADYVSPSPVFATRTKADAGEAIGLEGVSRIRAGVELPLVAIGGITRENARQVVEAGADCVCAISAVVGQEDVRAAVEDLLRVLR